jgi:hypothetical protein
LERLSKAIGALEGQIRGMPAPANDRMSERYRDEAGTLRSLLDCDQMLIGQADLLRSRLDHKDGTAILADLAEAEGGLSAIGETLRRRQAVLLAITGG